MMRQIGTSDAYAVVLTGGITELVSGGDPMSMMIEDMARTIIGGVLAATVLSLVVVPCLYVMFRREGALPVGAAVGVGETV